MINTIKIILQIKITTSTNTFIYFLQRLWLIGRAFNDTLYADSQIKNGIAIIVSILAQIKNIITKGLYLIIMVVLPILYAETLDETTKGNRLILAIHVIFILNCLLGSLMDSRIFSVTKDKVLCIKHMHMNPKRYVKASLLMKYLPFFTYYLIALLIVIPLLGGSLLNAIILWLSYISFRTVGEALQLFLYDKKGFVLSRKVLIVSTLIIIGLASAYLPMFTGFDFNISHIVLHPISVIVYIMLCSFSMHYITKGYKHYMIIIPESIDLKYIYSYNKEKAKQNSFKDVSMNDKDLHVLKDNNEKSNNLSGYSYLNSIFFTRHHRQLVKPIYCRLGIIAIALLIGIIIYMIKPSIAVTVSTKITSMVPIFVFAMYGITTASKACRAMFYNCDISLLHYGFYRKPRTILHNFRIRLIRISLHNIVIGLALCIAVVIFLSICKVEWMTLDMLMFSVSILLLSIFFTVHHLFMYYVFQPYTTDLSIKNPFFKILNSVIYILCYICFHIKTGTIGFTIVLLVFTMIYIITAVFLINKFAPKHFRVK